MSTLYFTSLSPGEGKTSLALATVASLRARGTMARYYKPFSASADDADARFCRQAMGNEAVLASPQGLDAQGWLDGLGAAGPMVLKALQPAAGGPVVCIEGLDAAGDTAKASAEMAAIAGAQVVAVLRYTRGMTTGAALALRRLFGGQLRGVVLNAVPSTSLRLAISETVPLVAAAGVPVLGVIPEDRLLLGFTVAEYSARLGGHIMNNHEQADKIVESLLVGANALDPGELYYATASNKALITRGDRPDLQFSALNTSTRCLILTAGVGPIPYVLDHAMEQEVPVVVVPGGTLATIASIETFVATASFHHRDKLARAVELVDAHIDVPALRA